MAYIGPGVHASRTSHHWASFFQLPGLGGTGRFGRAPYPQGLGEGIANTKRLPPVHQSPPPEPIKCLLFPRLHSHSRLTSPHLYQAPFETNRARFCERWCFRSTMSRAWNTNGRRKRPKAGVLMKVAFRSTGTMGWSRTCQIRQVQTTPLVVLTRPPRPAVFFSDTGPTSPPSLLGVRVGRSCTKVWRAPCGEEINQKQFHYCNYKKNTNNYFYYYHTPLLSACFRQRIM